MMIKNYVGTIDELAFAIGNTHYDITSIILNKIADNITKRAYETNSSKLVDISNCIYEAKHHIDNAWQDICKKRMTGECSKHPREVLGYKGTIDELAQDITNTSEEDLVKFLDKLGNDLLRQSNADRERGRKKLSTELYNAANCLYKVRMEL